MHERDAWFLQNRLSDVLRRDLPTGSDPSDFEFHAAEMKSPRHGASAGSNWGAIEIDRRISILSNAYRAIASYRPVDANYPVMLFGAVVEGRNPREGRAYEEVLHKFDEMLLRRGRHLNTRETGTVIHDRRAIERDVQRATQTWREISGRLGVLTHLADVPLFADSTASRLIQAADLVAWALWRYYGHPLIHDGLTCSGQSSTRTARLCMD